METKRNTGNVIRLSVAQALSMTTMNVNIINTALVGSLLSPVPWLATLGLSLQFVTSMLTTLPASLLMVKFGRRPIFLAGVLVAAGNFYSRHCNFTYEFYAILCGIDVSWHCARLRWLLSLCSGRQCGGLTKPRAISYVLAGGLLAAFLGLKLPAILLDSCPDTYMRVFFQLLRGTDLFTVTPVG